MRKKYFYLLLCVLIIAFLSACSSVPKSKIFGESPIALVSIVSNDEINWKDEGPINPNIITRSTRRAMEEDPDKAFMTKAADIMGDIESVIRATMSASPYVNFAPKETVFDSVSYEEARLNSHHEKAEMAQPDGFRFINFRDKNFMKSFYGETGLNKFMFITLDLTKNMSGGFSKFGNFRAIINMSVMLKDDRGRTLFNKKYEVYSRTQGKVSGGIYSHSEFADMLLEAIQDACYNLLDDIVY